MNWQPYQADRLLEIFNYPRVKKQIALYLKYLPKNERILEGGCGLGPYLIYLHRKGYEIIGVDYNEEPLKKIKAYDNSIATEVMDVRNLTFADRSFGGYLSLGVIEHFPKGPDKAIQEASRILKRGGIFIVQVPVMNIFLSLKYPLELLKRSKFLRRIFKREEKKYYWQCYFKPKGLRNILEKYGFNVVEIVPMDHEHSIISFSDIFRDKNSYDAANSKGLAFSRFCERHLGWLTAANMVLICRKEDGAG
jgi:SAM-dependent methyltransferase